MSGIQIKNRIGRIVMKYIIYMDVFFMVNLIMDTILLKLAAFYIQPHTTLIRCIAGGMAGSLLTCLSLFLSYDNMLLHMLTTYVFTAMLMVFVTFGKCSLKRLLKRTGGLYLVTVLLGGIMNLVYDYTYFGYVLHGMFSAVYNNPVNMVRMLMFTGISYILLNSILRLVKKKSGNQFVQVTLVLKGRDIKLKALIDSGNSLTDPYYGKPVHIAEYEALQRILEGVDIHREKYRLVPFHSLGKKNGMVEVIEFEELTVSETDGTGDDKEPILYQEKKPAIGLYHARLSGDRKYEMLLHGTVGGGGSV